MESYFKLILVNVMFSNMLLRKNNDFYTKLAIILEKNKSGFNYPLKLFSKEIFYRSNYCPSFKLLNNVAKTST